jgi:hypothetical protein
MGGFDMRERIEKDGKFLVIQQSEFTESPREWAEDSKMICFHSRYNLGDKHDYKDPTHFVVSLAEELGIIANSYETLYELPFNDKTIQKLLALVEQKVTILPLYLYDHSELAMNTTGFSCPWDSGQVGWIWSATLSEDELQKEVEWYDLYLRGEVFDAIYGTVDTCECCGQKIEETIDTVSDLYCSSREQFKTDLREFLPQEYHSLLEELLK